MLITKSIFPLTIVKSKWILQGYPNTLEDIFEMHYRLSMAKPLRDAVAGIVAGELGAAHERLKSADRDHAAIHSARKHFKKIRALLCLVEPAERGNKAKATKKLIASAARSLASSRDAYVVIGAAEALEKTCEGSPNARAFSDLLSFLRARRDRVEENLNHAGLGTVLNDLEKAKASLEKLDLRGAKMSDLLDSASGTYRKGRHAMKAALTDGSAEALHDWRKAVQRHWRQTLLLKEVWPKEAKARIALARLLSDVLGLHNDLTVLNETILANRIVFRSPGDVRMLCRCIEKKQADLLGEAASLGGRLYSEKAKLFAKRLTSQWHSGKHKGMSAEARLQAQGH